MLQTTIGQLLVNEALPAEMRDYTRVIDGGTLKKLLKQVAEERPEEYVRIVKELTDIGRDVSYATGGQSFGLRHLRAAPKIARLREDFRKEMQAILRSRLSQEAKKEKIIVAASKLRDKILPMLVTEGMKANNPLVQQVVSGSRGGPMFLARLMSGDILYTDHNDEIIPFPVLKGYAEGLSPAEYFAATFGARKGLITTKLSTADAGWLGKQLAQLAHNLLVTAVDAETPPEPGTPRGLLVDTADPDNAGALLAYPAGGYPRNTVLTPRILQELKDAGVDKLLVRSPTVGGPPNGGLYARDVGIRDKGRLPALGDLVGIVAAQALGEKISQLSLGGKHRGGTAEQVISLPIVSQFLNIPKAYRGGATHAQADGQVTRIEKSPLGGHFIFVGNTKHFAPPEVSMHVKVGDRVEAGDLLTSGLPNPAEIVKHKGIGEGRRYFTEEFTKLFRNSGLPAHRRNVEILARGLIDHVELAEELEDGLPGDIMPYSALEAKWQPREGMQIVAPKQAVGMYLEKPVLHYTIGTKVRPSMLPIFQKFDVKQVVAHTEPPPFVPRMLRAMDVVQNDPDWMTRFLGSQLQKQTLESLYRGRESTRHGVSYVPALAYGVEFGTEWPKAVLRPSAKADAP